LDDDLDQVIFSIVELDKGGILQGAPVVVGEQEEFALVLIKEPTP
jgi:hypothetical protein